jgi:glycine betaine/proline transport system ATP-binding protein
MPGCNLDLTCNLPTRAKTRLNAKSSSPEIACQHVWKVFGPNPAKVIEAIGTDQSRSQILASTGHVVAVRDVSFEVAKGETFVVMGLSGSGKSTLVRCLTRLTEPSDGHVLMAGQDVTRLDDRQLLELRRHRVSMVFQNFGLFPHRRVIDNVAFGLEVQGVKKSARLERANQMIELVGLAGWEQHFPKQLSGGMQQRVGLARALAVDPEILLFDEPFSALDPLIRREMQDELLRLQHVMHKTIVFITHDFVEALRLGDQIAIMRDGRFVQVGTPPELVLRPDSDYVSAFTKDAPRAKVLTAASIMQPTTTDGRVPGPNGPVIMADSKLEECIAVIAASRDPIQVLDGENRQVGCVDQASVLRALVG